MHPQSSIITAAVCTIALSWVLRALSNAADGPFLTHIAPMFWQCSTAASTSMWLLFEKRLWPEISFAHILTVTPNAETQACGFVS